MKQKPRDVYDLGYLRKYREMNRISCPVGWIALGLFALGLISVLVAQDATPAIDSRVYESSNGQRITYSAEWDYLLYADTVFVQPTTDAPDEREADTLRAIALLMVLSGVLLVLGYYGWWIPEKSKEAGWSLLTGEIGENVIESR